MTIPVTPPAEWFASPSLDGPTALTITPEGRVFGHLALWGTCHTGKAGCVTPPHSRSDYRYFHLGEIETACGSLIPCGQITIDTGHAGLHLGATAAVAHYDNTGTVVADVRAGEDVFGIWVSGAVRPGLSKSTLRKLRAAKLSGDWRDFMGSLEMIAALETNVPGFPVPRPAARIASGARVALVAAGIVPDACSCGPTPRQRARIKALALRTEGREALLNRIAS